VTISSRTDGGDLWDVEPCVTGADGTCSLTANGIGVKTPSMTFTVDDVAHATLTYEATDNVDPDGDSDGTSIVVALP
jgi:hypothetical protein